MSGQLFIHIGPPKTATTSLQIAWEKLSAPQYRYLGVYQPRDRNVDSSSQRLLNSVSSNFSSEKNNLLDAELTEVSSFVSSGGVALLSEEILSLNEPDNPLERKMCRMRNLVGHIPTTLLITLRDPVVGIPSLYQEVYSSLPIALRLNFAQFCKDERTLCYDYPRLAEILTNTGFDQIRWLDFRSIEQSALSTRAVFGDYDMWDDVQIPIGKDNASVLSPAGDKRLLPAIPMRSLGDIPAVQAIVDGLKLRGSVVTKLASSLAKRINLRPQIMRKLSVPSDIAKARRSGYLKTLAGLPNAPFATPITALPPVGVE